MSAPPRLAWLLLLAAPAPALAARCPPMAGADAALQQADARARLRFIHDNLRDAARASRVWTWLWGSGYAASATINLAISPVFADPGRRIEAYVSAASSAIGVASLLISPPQVLRDQRRLADLARRGRGSEDVCALLAEAERILQRDAASDAFGKGPITRAGSVIYNLGVGMLLAYGFDRREGAALNTLIGVLVSQFMVTTRPARTVRALERYRSAQLGPAPPERLLQWALVPDLSLQRVGVQAALSF